MTRRNSVEQTIKELEDFLQSEGIEDSKALEKILINEKAKAGQLYEKERYLKETIKQNSHPADELRKKARTLTIYIDELSKRKSEIENRISREKELLNEFQTAQIKLIRIDMAGLILKGVSFESCPQCGSALKNKKELSNHCSLCSQSLNTEISVNKQTYNQDLIERIKELEQHIKFNGMENVEITKRLVETKQNKNELDNKLMEIEQDYDSKYLAKIREIERERGKIDYILERKD
jgi:DNA repair exonuclease SbcCD ATPase subunit